MRDLLALQESFQHYLLTGNTAIVEHIVSNQRHAVERLEIYFNAYRLRLVEVLKHEFPKTYLYLGEEEFVKLSLAYLKVYPSDHFSARYIGKNLATFLQQTQCYPANPEIIELVQFEWLLSEAMDAADAPLFTQTDLCNLPSTDWPDFIFVLHPAVRVLALKTNISVIWHELTAEATMITPLQVYNTEHLFIIWRTPAMQVMFKSLTPLGAGFVRMLIIQKSFADLCEGLCAFCEVAEVPSQALAILQWLVGNNCLCREVNYISE